MFSRRRFITDSVKIAGLCGISTLLDLPLLDGLALAETGPAPLRYRAAQKGLFYGASSFKRILSTDPLYASKFIEQCGILTADWELKWKPLRPTPTSFDFAAFDWLLGFAKRHNMLFRGHTLVWHEDLPPWFAGTVNGSNAARYLTEHITTVMKRHAGKVHSWDVVNEPIAVWDRDLDGIRTASPWYRLLGPDYIEFAFRTAAKADPNAMLVLNQDRIEQDRQRDNATRAATLKLLRRLKASGTPIHALGIESHLGGADATFNKKKFQRFLREVADLGLKIIISEIDINDSNLTGDIKVRDNMIAELYRDYLNVALAEPAVIGVINWGLSDKYTWLRSYAPRPDKLPVRPLPLDQAMNKKPAWFAIADALDQAPRR